MKKLLLLSSMFVLTLTCLAQQGVWVPQATGFVPTSSGVREVIPVDSNIVWVIAYDGDPNTGGIFRNDYSITNDGGASWHVGYVPTDVTTYDWAGLTAISDSTAWAIFFNSITNHTGQIWKTTDAGLNWVQQDTTTFSSLTSFPNNIYFWDANNGLVVGDQVNGEFEFYTTTDGGTTWTPVPGANIPDPADSLENAWTTHFEVVGDTVWFDTNEGRVYRSVDRGMNWTVGNTTLAIYPNVAPAPSIDICFTSGSYGIARFFDDGTLTNTVVNTTDGGMTWDTIAVTGDLFTTDIENVPGTSTIISTGNSGTNGSSYSSDGGMTWVTIETGTQRGYVGIADSIHMWSGGFTFDPTDGGIYKWELFPTVLCSDPSISTGTTTASDTSVCDGDSILFTVTGGIGPEDGYYSGIGWVFSAVDISGSTSPLTSAIGVHRVTLPASLSNTQMFINDGAVIDGSTNLYGLYYWTPIFFGNASQVDPTVPVNNFNQLTLDPNCTFTGTSIPVMVYGPNDIHCSVGISEVNKGALMMNSYMKDQNTLALTINSATGGKATIQLLDLTGRLVKTENTNVNSGVNNETLNVSDLATGTYIVKAKVNGNEVSGKVVKY
jgi:hypothetical protein